MIGWVASFIQRISFTAMLLAFAMLSGCQLIDSTGTMARSVMDRIDKSPRIASLRMQDPYFPDERRQGINSLADRSWGRQPPFTDQYATLAKDDDDFLVRATALRALNRSRDPRTSIYVTALNDANEHVRLEAVKALIKMPDNAAAPILAKMVTDPNENKDVRIAAADALKHYRSVDVARALIAQLGGRDFGIAWQSRRSLVNITGKDMRYDENAWMNYVRGPEKPLG